MERSISAGSGSVNSGGQSQEAQQEGRQQCLLPGNLDRAVAVLASVSSGGRVTNSLDDVWIRRTIC